jgi:poly(A) polymerase Pap1
LCSFVFQRIGPLLKKRVDEEVTLLVEVTSADEPIGKLSFRAAAVDMVLSALKEVLRYGRP